VTLKDTAFFNEYIQNFTAGTLLSFTIDTTNVPDQEAHRICSQWWSSTVMVSSFRLPVPLTSSST
jgi:hypothetical protein